MSFKSGFLSRERVAV